MIESLIQAEPLTQILLVVRDQTALLAAWDDFDAHTKLFERGLLRTHHGSFRADAEQRVLTWINPDDPDAPTDGPHVYLAIGDCSSSRQLRRWRRCTFMVAPSNTSGRHAGLM